MSSGDKKRMKMMRKCITGAFLGGRVQRLARCVPIDRYDSFIFKFPLPALCLTDHGPKLKC